ncbi:MAG: orotate phosphoribosyltransferase [Chloroflexia bacterium]
MVLLRPAAPFRFASGLLSPIYCDNRLLISFPRQRRQITLLLARRLREEAIPAEVIAGTATAGIPHAAWLAAELALPMVYVRPRPKEHGQEQQVEGMPPAGQHVVLVEDLVTTGGSALESVQALRQAGAWVEHVLTIFSYDFPTTAQAFAQAGVHLHPLTTLPTLLEVAVARGHLTPAERAAVEEWARDPLGWSRAREAGPASGESRSEG